MINIDKFKAEYIETLKREGFYKEENNESTSIYMMLQEYDRTRSIKTAADIVENLKNYHILDHELYYKLLEDSQELQALKEKQRKSARRTNGMLTPQKLSERNRKAAIARWNKVKESKLIRDIK